MLRNNTRVSTTCFIGPCLRLITTAMTVAPVSINRWNRIIAPLTKRVTAQDSTTREKKAPQCAMGFNGLNCITGAGGGKTTTWRQKWGNEVTIAPY